MKRCSLLFALGALAIFSGCSLLLPGDGVLDLTGRIERIEVDCGGWGLQTTDDLYELVNLPDAYKVDGLRVRMEFKPRGDLVSCAMAGRIVEVVSVERTE